MLKISPLPGWVSIDKYILVIISTGFTILIMTEEGDIEAV
jgi:hypothetical protein